jgi:hypothetical protein
LVPPANQPYSVLFVGAADASAQVDHIAGKAGSGSNCYSNARLVSKHMNLKLNNSDIKAQVNAYFEDNRNHENISTSLTF